MSRAMIVHQHTNNYGDDAAGAALAQQLETRLKVEHTDIFYIWQKSGDGLQLDEDRFTNHLIPELSGAKDMRVSTALALIRHVALRRQLPPWLSTIVRTAQNADHVFVSPAGANVGIYKDWMYLLVLLALVHNGVRPIFHLNTIGQSNSRAFNAVARWVLRRSELNVREVASADWLASQKLSSYLGVDTAVLLAVANRQDVAPPLSGDPYIALVPTGLSNWHRDFRSTDDSVIHRAVCAAAADAARARGLGVVIVPHLYGPEDESPLLTTMKLELESLGCTSEVATITSHEGYRSVLAGAQATISMRYHGLILSAISGVPCVAVAYENKMVEAAAYLGLADLCRSSNATSDELAQLLGHAIDMRAEYGSTSPTRMKELHEIAMGPVRSAAARGMRDARG